MVVGGRLLAVGGLDSLDGNYGRFQSVIRNVDKSVQLNTIIRRV